MLPLQYVKNSRAKHYRLTVKSDHVRVTIPRWGSRRKAEEFVESKKDWLVKNAQSEQNLPPLGDQEIEHLRKIAQRYIPERVEALAAEHGFRFNDIRIKNIRSRWGSCSKQKNLNFSLHLMRVESRYIDYVILHELCHTVQMNHGPKFWNLLESVCPGARELDREMRKFSKIF